MSAVTQARRSLRRAASLQPGEGRRLGLSVLLGWGTLLAGIGLMSTSGFLISRAAQRPEILSLTAAITAVRGFGVARALLRYLERIVSHDFALRVLARLRTAFYASLAPLGIAALGSRRRGDLLTRFVADVDSLQDLYLRALAPPLVALLVTLAAGITAAIMLPSAGILLVGCLLVSALLVSALTAAIVASAGRRQAAIRAQLTCELLDGLDGSVELAVAGRAPEWSDRIDGTSRRLTRLGTRDAIAGAAASALQSACAGATVILILLVAIPAVHDGRLSAVLLAALVMLALGAFEGIQPLPLAARRLRASAESASRLQEIEALCPAVTDAADSQAVGASGELRLDRVSLAFGPGRPVLDEVSLRLGPRCRVALTGPSGSGKTTLAQLLVRFSDPSAGRIELGGTDLRRVTLDELRRHVVLIAQDAHVFNTTVRENLLLARRNATEAELWAALEAVRLAGHVRSLRNGIDTLVGENGEQLSGGQRQRLTVARALVSDARLIVLDEPTAQLDFATAAELIRAVSAAAGDRGLLVITHRLDDVADFQAIYELRDGHLRPRG